MNEILFTVLKCMVAICAALISAYLIPYIKRLAQNERYRTIVDMIETAVMASEKTMKDKDGKDRKAAVEAYAYEWLNQHGISITEEQLSALIEAAVYELC